MRPNEEPRPGAAEAIVVRPGEPRAHPRVDGGDEETRLRGEIDETRAEMSETIEAIQDRLNPDRVGEQVERVAEQVKEQIRESVQELTADAKVAIREATVGRVEQMIGDARESVNDLRYGLMDRVRANPVPAALAGLGLAWLLFSDSGSRSRRRWREERYYVGPRTVRYGYGPRPGYAAPAGYVAQADYAARGGYVGQADYAERFHEEEGAGTAEQVGAQAERVAGDAREGAERLVGDARERVDELTDVAGEQLGRARDRFGELLGDSPLAIGAIALGVGAAVGLAMPTTEQENEWLGDARDQLLGRAKEAVAEVGEQARSVAQEQLGKSG